MNETRDSSNTAPADDGSGLDPRDAAALVDQTRRQARRWFEPNPPLFTLVRAAIVLGGYVALWLSVRKQHPYKGPTGTAVLVFYTLLIIVIISSVVVLKRASEGVRGVSRSRPAEVTVLATAWIVAYVFQGALRYEGASPAIVYGMYAAVGPLIIVGLVGAALAQARSNWPTVAATLTVVVVSVGGAFAGPVTSWLVAGAGLTAALLVHAAATARLQRR